MGTGKPSLTPETQPEAITLCPTPFCSLLTQHTTLLLLFPKWIPVIQSLSLFFFNPSLVSFRGRKFSDKVSYLSLKKIFQEETESLNNYQTTHLVIDLRLWGFWRMWAERPPWPPHACDVLGHPVSSLNCNGSWESKVSVCDIHQDSSFPLEPQVNSPLINLLMRFYQQKEYFLHENHPEKSLLQIVTEGLFCAWKRGKDQPNSTNHIILVLRELTVLYGIQVF